MKGDFTRDSFDPHKRFTRVLMQQGRVQLDADFNEQAAILLHYMQTLAKDLIGPHGGWDTTAFKIASPPPGQQQAPDFHISPGNYYVEGILCENPGEGTAYRSQADYPLPIDLPDEEKVANGNLYLVYVDVWERHITHLDDESIREEALGGQDTATRTTVVWQVKALLVKYEEIAGVASAVPITDPNNTPEKLLEDKLPAGKKRNKGMLSARVRPMEEADDRHIIPLDSLYRGTENQLYRVEIHKPNDGITGTGPTFKWSRNNGSDVFPISTLQGDTALVEDLGWDLSRSLEPNDWVEVMDDHYVKQGRPGPLLRIDHIDKAKNAVTLRSNANADYDENEAKQKHALLRRWDSAGEIDVTFSSSIPDDPNDGWIPLEDGIEVRFEVAGDLQTGDYWMIPARTATGNIQWPQRKSELPNHEPEAVPPHGIKHHYAPLGYISVDRDGKVVPKKDYRRVFEQISKRP
jgi:hypothetical protein